MAITHIQDVGVYSGASASIIVKMVNTIATDTLLAAFCLPDDVSVVSVTDSTNNRWIAAAYSQPDNQGNCELWQARGIQGGTASVTAVFTAASVGANISEWGSIWAQSPLDSWSQMFSTSASVTPTAVSPRTTGELVITVGNSAASVNGQTGGYTALSVPGNTGFAAGYQILSGSVVPQTFWGASGASPWAAIEAAFLPVNSATVGAATGPAGVNALLQFPEVAVQVCETMNFLAPIQGIATWTDISSYCKHLSVSEYGRAHLLDRVQATAVDIVVNNRDGTFNAWNTGSFIYPGGLDPMTPIKVTAAWNGVTSSEAYGYIQSITPNITDVLNVDVTIAADDILALLAKKYLSNNNFQQLVTTDGGANLAAYYRLGDSVGSYSVKDSSGQSQMGSLIAGLSGVPNFGNAGPFLYDPNTALDCTAGTNVLNAGFSTIDNTTEPPTIHDPLGAATSWTYECWAKWTSTTQAVPGAVTAFTAEENASYPSFLRITNVLNTIIPAVGSTITGPGIPPNTVVTSVGSAAGTTYVGISNNWTGAGGTSLSFTSTIGGTGSTLFSAANVPGVGSLAVDIRVGATTAASITSFNRVNVGTYNSTNGSYTAPVSAAGNINVLDGSWHHIVVPYAASVASIYVDGAFSASAGTGAGWANPKTVTIGCDQKALNGWVGWMSDVALYTTTLTASQIQNHYTIGKFFQQQEFGASVGGTNAGRFNKLMAVVGLDPSIMLQVPYPFRTTLYAETNQITTTSGLNYMQTMSESEPGLIFQLPSGQIAAYSRQFQYLNPTSMTSQAIFGDSAAASVVYHYDGPSFHLVQDDLDTWTDVQVQSGRSGALNAIGAPIGGQSGAQLQEWGPSQSATMAAAASVVGNRTLQGLTSLQMNYDADALAIAQQYADWYHTPRQRVTLMTINSQGNQGVNIPQMLQRGIYDRITVQYLGQSPGPQFSSDYLLEQIQHTVDMSQPTWQTTWATSLYEIIESPTILGVWTFGSAPAVLTL